MDWPRAACALILLLPGCLFADVNSSATLTNGATLNLDTGTSGTSGGDIQWNGSSLTPQGSAKGFGLPVQFLGSAAFQAITPQQLAGFTYSSGPISGVNVALNWIIAIHTNGGNYAKLLVTANSGGSITLQFTTYITAALPPPTISAVQNNYSYILAGLPNYGIAPGSLFIVKGTNLATNAQPVLQSSAGGLPLTLNGASLSVTVGGATVTPALYYTSASQLAAVLPSSTPVGTGIVTVSVNGQTASAPMVVVSSALGLDVATDANTGYFYETSAAMPGQTIILWGSGVGADTANDDKTFPLQQDNLTNVPLTIYIGGVAVTPQYRGRSQYPGVDQVNVVIPNNVPLGCYVSVVAMSGAVVSNSITLPVAQNGTCSDISSFASIPLLRSFAGKPQVNLGTVSILQETVVSASQSSSTTYQAASSFLGYQGQAYVANLGSFSLPSLASCIFLPGSPPSSSGLSAGAISVSGSGTAAVTLAATGPGSASGSLASVPAQGGAYTFTGSGGTDVKGFPPLSMFRRSSPGPISARRLP